MRTTTQTPPSARPAHRPARIDQLQDIPLHLKPRPGLAVTLWSCNMEDTPTTWRDILGAVIIGASLGLLLAAFI